MITWIIGNTKAGKTTLANIIKNAEPSFNYSNSILLDGNKMREVWTDLDLSRKGRITQNIRIAKLAKVLSEQGHNIIIATICPYGELRKEIKKIIDCKFIYIEGGKEGEEYPFDKPNLYE